VAGARRARLFRGCDRHALPCHDPSSYYNDDHGHQAGDRLLRRSQPPGAATCARPTSSPARHEEFALALPACEIDAAGLLLERLREATPGGQTCSAGLVAWDRIESTDQLIGRADAALYEAKAAGRNRVIPAT
jgi:PleD family two-component response regulator